MVFILLTLQLIAAATVSLYLIKPDSTILKRVVCIVLVTAFCWLMGVFLTFILSPHEAQSSYINISIGAGIWFSLGGAVYGCIKGIAPINE